MTSRRQLLIAAGAGVFATILFFFFVLSPKLSQFQSVRDEIAAAEQQEQTLKAELQRLRGIEKRRTTTIQQLAVLTGYLPSSPDLPTFIQLVQKAATGAGVDLRSIGPSAPTALEDAEGVQTISVTLSLRGAFGEIEDFLSRVENLKRAVEIASLSLSPTVDELSGATVLDATIQGVMYVVQPDASLSGAGSGRTVGGGGS